jgi:hypothetical protein
MQALYLTPPTETSGTGEQRRDFGMQIPCLNLIERERPEAHGQVNG